MRISSLLTVIIFCCLLFMEELDEEEKAEILFLAQMGKLRARLSDLQWDIESIDPNAKANGRIKSLFYKVDSATKELTRKLPPERGKINKYISISSELGEAEGQMKEAESYLSSKSIDSSELLDKIDKLEKIWEMQIQAKVDEAINTAH